MIAAINSLRGDVKSKVVNGDAVWGKLLIAHVRYFFRIAFFDGDVFAGGGGEIDSRDRAPQHRKECCVDLRGQRPCTYRSCLRCRH